jgi:hypothetical protein
MMPGGAVLRTTSTIQYYKVKKMVYAKWRVQNSKPPRGWILAGTEEQQEHASSVRDF